MGRKLSSFRGVSFDPPVDAFGVFLNYFVNRTPLISRLVKYPVNASDGKFQGKDGTQYQIQKIQHWYESEGRAMEQLDRNRLLAAQHCFDDFEASNYYGQGVPISAPSARPQMIGLRNLIRTHKTTEPRNADAYTLADFQRDLAGTIEESSKEDESPPCIVISHDFLPGLVTWGYVLERIDVGETIFRQRIDLFRCPALPGKLSECVFLPAPLLRHGTAIALHPADLGIGLVRPFEEIPRASRGDMYEGEFIIEGCITLDNEARHAWLSGIKRFAE